jgi:RNA polymerase sigma-70 factor (ECF subfamily)
MALDRQRANRRRLAREVADDVRAAGLQTRRDLATTSDTAIDQERAEQLWRAIDALPEKLRLVIVLAGIQGHDIREVALLLDVPDGTVKSRLFLARKQLKEQLSWMAKDTASR